MVSESYLAACAKAEITRQNPDKLTDIGCVQINKGYAKERIINYLSAVGNPYCFRVKDTLVKVVFSSKPDAPTIENALVNIVSGLSG